MKGFLPIERAGVYITASDDPWNVCVYPDGNTWWQLRQSSEASQHERNLESGSILLLGSPGTGKTFTMLLNGYRWLQGPISPVDRSSERRLALYAPVSKIDVDDFAEQLDTLRNMACLWLIDDAHEDPERARDIIDLAQELNIESEGHRIVMAAWTDVRTLAAHRLKVIRLELSTDKIRAAIALLDEDRVVPESTCESLLCPAVGLRQILWTARNYPHKLTDRQFVQTRWVADTVEPLDDVERDLLLRLARFRFLGLASPPPATGVSRKSFKRMRDFGLIKRDSESGLWLLTNDELARAVLHSDYSSKTRSNATEWFVEPLLRYASEYIQTKDWLNLGNLVKALRRRWTSVSARFGYEEDPSTDQESLLEIAIRDKSWLESVLRFVSRDELPVDGLCKLLVDLASVSCGLTQRRVRTASTRLLRERLDDIKRDLASGDLVAWQSVVSLESIYSVDEAHEILVSTLSSDKFLSNLSRLPSGRRGQYLITIAELSPESIESVMRSLKPVLGDELRETRQFWRFLRKVASKCPSIAAELIVECDPQTLGRWIMSDARAGNHFYARLWARAAKAEIRKCFRKALAVESLLDDAEQAWAADSRNLHQLTRMVRYRPEIAPPSLKSSIVGYLEGAVNHGEGELLTRSVYSLGLLDSRRASEVLGERLSTLERLPDKPQDAFFLLFASLTYLSRNKQTELKRISDEAIANWLDRYGETKQILWSLAVYGACTFVVGHSGSRPQDATERITEWEPLFEPTRPAATAFQFLLSSFVYPTGTPFDSFAESRFGCLVAPGRLWLNNWKNSAPRGRRVLLTVICEALGNLAGRDGTDHQVRTLVEAIASPTQDDIWDPIDAGLRLRTVLKFGSESLGADLVQRPRAARGRGAKRFPKPPEPT